MCQGLFWISIDFCNSHSSPEGGYYQPPVTGGPTEAQRMLNDLPMSPGCQVVEEESTPEPVPLSPAHPKVLLQSPRWGSLPPHSSPTKHKTHSLSQPCAIHQGQSWSLLTALESRPREVHSGTHHKQPPGSTDPPWAGAGPPPQSGGRSQGGGPGSPGPRGR